MIQVAVIIIAVGVVLWLANTFIPMEARVRILNGAVIIVLVLWLLMFLLRWAGVAPTMP
jgi:hypothetical protein